MAGESDPHPASVYTDFNESVEDISPGEEIRLLAVYDKFTARTWAH